MRYVYVGRAYDMPETDRKYIVFGGFLKRDIKECFKDSSLQMFANQFEKMDIFNHTKRFIDHAIGEYGINVFELTCKPSELVNLVQLKLALNGHKLVYTDKFKSAYDFKHAIELDLTALNVLYKSNNPDAKEKLKAFFGFK